MSTRLLMDAAKEHLCGLQRANRLAQAVVSRLEELKSSDATTLRLDLKKYSFLVTWEASGILIERILPQGEVDQHPVLWVHNGKLQEVSISALRVLHREFPRLPAPATPSSLAEPIPLPLGSIRSLKSRVLVNA